MKNARIGSNIIGIIAIAVIVGLYIMVLVTDYKESSSHEMPERVLRYGEGTIEKMWDDSVDGNRKTLIEIDGEDVKYIYLNDFEEPHLIQGSTIEFAYFEEGDSRRIVEIYNNDNDVKN